MFAIIYLFVKENTKPQVVTIGHSVDSLFLEVEPTLGAYLAVMQFSSENLFQFY